MNHYPHHIGDFDRATRHLTRIERSIYRDLIDLYYETEQPLTLDMKKLCRRIIAISNEEVTAVEQVLNEFFTETPTGWYQSRCEAEIERYRTNSSQKAVAGKASAEAKRLKKLHALNGKQAVVQQPLKSVETEINGDPTNQEPRTSNQEPVTNIHTEQPSETSNFTPGSACVFLTGLGVVHTNPAHPDLLAALGGGATREDFIYAASEAARKAKPFGYLLKIVLGQIEDRKNAISKPQGQRTSSQNCRQHAERIGEHLDKLIEQEFGQGVDIGSV